MCLFGHILFTILSYYQTICNWIAPSGLTKGHAGGQLCRFECWYWNKFYHHQKKQEQNKAGTKTMYSCL